jgi:hypothetical protein
LKAERENVKTKKNKSRHVEKPLPEKIPKQETLPVEEQPYL